MSEITPNTPNPVREDAYKQQLAAKLGIDPKYIPGSPIWHSEEEIAAIAEMFSNMAGGGSGGGALVVGITYDSQTDLYSCNKTAGEIWSAYAAGSNVVFSDTEYDDVVSLVYAFIDSGSYNFYACGYDATTARFIFAANSSTDNPVQVQPE